MSLIGFKAQNHRQQTSVRGARDEIDDRETDPRAFEDLEDRFGPFTLDVAANHYNAKCPRYFTIEDDGLAQSWAGERVWCNPPFSNIEPWVRKAWASMETHNWIDVPDGTPLTGGRGFRFCTTCDREEWPDGTVFRQGWMPGCKPAEKIVMLLPANRTEQRWWQDHVEPHRDNGDLLHVRFLRGRMRFLQPGEQQVRPNSRPPFGVCLLIWSWSSDDVELDAEAVTT